MSQYVDTFEAQLPTYCFQIVDIVMDAAFQLRTIGQCCGATSITQIVEHHLVGIAKPRNVLLHINRVWNDHNLAADALDVVEQPCAVGGDQIAFVTHRDSAAVPAIRKLSTRCSSPSPRNLRHWDAGDRRCRRRPGVAKASPDRESLYRSRSRRRTPCWRVSRHSRPRAFVRHPR